jgi:hypothetical protein
MSVEGYGRLDVPKIVVRPLQDSEGLPFYSTEQLLFGVCHIVPSPEERVGKVRAINKAQQESQDRFAANQNAIWSALETQGICKVATTYGFDTRTLKRLLGAKSE